MRILIVEDESSLADVIARNLRARGHDATVASTAEGALAEAAGTPLDALILDINLPDLTGWDVLRGLPADIRRTMRVVVISAAPISPKRIDEFKPDCALLKPFPIDALVRALGGFEHAAAEEEAQ